MSKEEKLWEMHCMYIFKLCNCHVYWGFAREVEINATISSLVHSYSSIPEMLWIYDARFSTGTCVLC